MESFEKRRREKQKQEKLRAKAARKLQDPSSSGPSEADYFADIDAPRSSGNPAPDAEPDIPGQSADTETRPGPDGLRG